MISFGNHRHAARVVGVRRPTAKALASDLSAVFQRFPASGRPNEAQTEDDLIWKVLGRLGWADWLRNQNLTHAVATTFRTGSFASAATRRAKRLS